MFRASASGTPKLEGMYVRVGSNSGPQTPESPGSPESTGGPGGTAESKPLDAHTASLGAGLAGVPRPWAGCGGLRGARERAGAARALLDRPLTSYYLIAGITTLLL